MVGDRRKDHRINLRLDGELLQFVREFAQKNRTTVTQVIIDHLNGLKKKEDRTRGNDCANQ